MGIDVATCLTNLACCDEINNLIGISDNYKSLKAKINSHNSDKSNQAKETITYKEIAIRILALTVEDQNKVMEVLCKDSKEQRMLLNAISKISSGKGSKDRSVTGRNTQVTVTRNMKPRGCTVNGIHYSSANDAVNALCGDGIIKRRDIPTSSFNAHKWLPDNQGTFGYTYNRDK